MVDKQTNKTFIRKTLPLITTSRMRDLVLPEKAFPHAEPPLCRYPNQNTHPASLYRSAFRLQRLRQCPGQTPSTGLRHPSFNHCRI